MKEQLLTAYQPSKLYKYQEDIVNSQIKKSSALFMDMGCGKTITSLNILKKYPIKKILIICLISKLNDWKTDLKKECNEDSIILNKGTKKNEKLLFESNNVIINFESCWRLLSLLDWVDKDTVIIIDESHKIKNPNSKIGKFCQKLGALTKYKIILTGTPQSQGYIDYYNQLKFIDLIDCTFPTFKKEFCIFDKISFNGFPVQKLVGYKNTAILDELIHNNCVFYKRTLEDNLIPTDITINFDKPKVYDKFKKVRIYKDVVADSNGKLFSCLRECCSGIIGSYIVDNQKLQWVSDFLECVNDRVVIFYNFNNERDLLISLLNDKKIAYSEYSGRIKSFDNFINNDKSVILVQYKSGSTGINELCISNKCIFYSLPLEHIDMEQSKKRIDRIGQKNKPLFYYLICSNTIEEKILKSLQEGKDFDEKLFQSYLLDSEED